MYEEPSTRNTWSPLVGALMAAGLGEAFGDVFGLAEI
jgi:hypothetical protein